MSADPEQRTREDELRASLVGWAVEQVKERDGTAYLRLSKPGGEERFVSFGAASFADALSSWPPASPATA